MHEKHVWYVITRFEAIFQSDFPGSRSLEPWSRCSNRVIKLLLYYFFPFIICVSVEVNLGSYYWWRYDSFIMTHNKWFLHYSCWRGMIRVPPGIMNPLLTLRIPKFSSRTSSDDSLSDSASAAAFSTVGSSVFEPDFSPSRITLVIKWINANIGKFPLIWRGNKGFWLRNGDDNSSVDTFERFNIKKRVR